MNCTEDSAGWTPLVRTTVSGDSPALEIVRAVAAVENAEPHALAPLGDTIDPDALEAMVESGDESLRTSFVYAGHRVVVRGETVEIY